MLKHLSEDEEILFELLSMPRSFCEVLFSDAKNLSLFEGEKFLEIRPFQEMMQSYEYSVGEDKEEGPQENFLRKKGAGDSYNLSARNLGKTFIFLVLDILQSMVYNANMETMISSFDAIHLRKVFDDFLPTINFHPCFKGLKRSFVQNPNFKLIAINGFKLDGINENVANKNTCGAQFAGKHVSKRWEEEFSETSEKAQSMSIDAEQMEGCLKRFSGMTNMTKFSPAGEVYYDKSMENIVMTVPQAYSKEWSDKVKQDRIKKYKSEQSPAYKINVLGQVIEDGLSALNIELIRKCYEEVEIKRFEIDDKNYDFFENLIILNKPNGTNRVFIGGDIGESSQSDIVIVFETEDKLKYRYNIVLRKLIHTQQIEIFKFIIDSLDADFIGIDCGSGSDGRVILRELAKIYGVERFFEYVGSKKIEVGFKEDKDGTVVRDKGKPVIQEEYMRNWGLIHMRDTFYNGDIIMSLDHQLDQQLNSVISMKSGNNRIVYRCTAEDDHKLDAFIVLFCTIWHFRFTELQNKKKSKKKFCKGIV